MIHAAQNRKELQKSLIHSIGKTTHFLSYDLCFGKHEEIQQNRQSIEQDPAYKSVRHIISGHTKIMYDDADCYDPEGIGKYDLCRSKHRQDPSLIFCISAEKQQKRQICHDLQNSGTLKINLQCNGSCI